MRVCISLCVCLGFIVLLISTVLACEVEENKTGTSKMDKNMGESPTLPTTPPKPTEEPACVCKEAPVSEDTAPVNSGAMKPTEEVPGSPIGRKLTKDELVATLSGCGKVGGNTRRHRKKIYGGKIAETVPWAVSIMQKRGGKPLSHQCGGTLISRRHVVTAAHCFYKQHNPCCNKTGRKCSPQDEESASFGYHNTAVVVGIPNAKQHTAENLFRPKEAFIMKEYAIDGCWNGNDVTLVELEHDIPDALLVANKAMWACLPDKEQSALPNVFEASGWGEDPDAETNTVGSDIKTVTLEWLNITQCLEKRPHVQAKDIFCTKETFEKEKEQGTNVCKGDSGGGLTSLGEDGRRRVYGVVSFGTDCVTMWENADDGQGGVFTDLRHHLQWICDKTGVCPATPPPGDATSTGRKMN